MGVFFGSASVSATNGHFREEQSISAFIAEPRISAAKIPELPLFFSQPRSFYNDEALLQPNNGHRNERLLKPVKNQIPPPSPLQLQPSPMLDKTTDRYLGHRLGNGLSIHANGIMSENVQQRYLFSKKPNYGPLSIPVTTTYYPVTKTSRNSQDSGFFDREESQNYSYKSRPFGRRPSDTREPMPKLGQGDARLGDGILFGERKSNGHSSL